MGDITGKKAKRAAQEQERETKRRRAEMEKEATRMQENNLLTASNAKNEVTKIINRDDMNSGLSVDAPKAKPKKRRNSEALGFK